MGREVAEPYQGQPMLAFPDPAAWEKWLAAEHAGFSGLWLKLAKKGCPGLVGVSRGCHLGASSSRTTGTALLAVNSSALQVLGSAAAALDRLPRGAEHSASGESCG